MAQEYRSIDGSGNNLNNLDWGKSGIPLRRITQTSYGDGLSTPAGANRPNPREISNIVLNQTERTLNSKNASDYFWCWGQFVDHDIDLSVEINPLEYFHIQIPKGDLYFDPLMTGNVVIPFKRSKYEIDSDGVRQQINSQSSFIDASNVYGDSAERAQALRLNDGSGKLKTGPEGLLPYNTLGFPNATDSSSEFYLAGDIRANEQSGLTALHALWVKEHNRIVHLMYYENPDFGEEKLYQEARRRVIALHQIITFKEFLPILLGNDGIDSYQGYQSNINPGIANIFSTACYRLGHSLVSSQLLRLKDDLTSIDEGPLQLRDGFFMPEMLTVNGGMEPILRGLAKQVCEELNARTVGELRNFLFGMPGSGGMDLAALNIQRGRDHGLPTYNDAREDLGLSRKISFEDISSDEETVSRLSQVYNSVDEIDIWVGGLSEDPYQDSLLGELFFAVVKRQFEAVRDGDRFWYQNNQFSDEELVELEATKLSDVIRRNTLINSEIQDNVFLVMNSD